MQINNITNFDSYLIIKMGTTTSTSQLNTKESITKEELLKEANLDLEDNKTKSNIFGNKKIISFKDNLIRLEQYIMELNNSDPNTKTEQMLFCLNSLGKIKKCIYEIESKEKEKSNSMNEDFSNIIKSILTENKEEFNKLIIKFEKEYTY